MSVEYINYMKVQHKNTAIPCNFHYSPLGGKLLAMWIRYVPVHTMFHMSDYRGVGFLRNWESKKVHGNMESRKVVCVRKLAKKARHGELNGGSW